MSRPLLGLSCWLGLCPHFTNSDDTGVWGECAACGNRAGFVSSAELRRYADAHAPPAEPLTAPKRGEAPTPHGEPNT